MAKKPKPIFTTVLDVLFMCMRSVGKSMLPRLTKNSLLNWGLQHQDFTCHVHYIDKDLFFTYYAGEEVMYE